MDTNHLINIIRRNDSKTLGDLFRIWWNKILGKKPVYRPDVVYDKISLTDTLTFESSQEAVISIIIPAHNNWDYTYACLYSILHNTDDVAYEIIVADDMSTDETINIRNHVKGVKIIRNVRNIGFLRTCNRAVKIAKGKYLLFLNNDTNVQKEWLRTLVEVLEKDIKVGLVGSKLVYPDGLLQDAGGIVWNNGECWTYGKYDDPEKSEYNIIREADYVSGACMIIRRDLWQDIGGFDVRFEPAYYEDTDLAFEARKQGLKVVYQPESVVVHFEGTTSGTDERRGVKKYQRINREKFYRKWEEVLQDGYPELGVIRLSTKPITHG